MGIGHDSVLTLATTRQPSNFTVFFPSPRQGLIVTSDLNEDLNVNPTALAKTND